MAEQLKHGVPLRDSEVFVNASFEFCLFIETYNNYKDFLIKLSNHLLNIYQLGNQLPIGDISENKDYTPNDISQNDFELILKSLSERLSDNRYYWQVFDPLDDQENDPVLGDLLDDIGDIYKDLKRSLTLFNEGTNLAKNTAMWQFKFEFDNHWSDHCISALYALHFFIKKMELAQPSQSSRL